MRTILFLMSLLLSIGGYAGQKYEVKGKVTDAMTKLALSGVVVTNVQTTESTSTDRDGNYRIQAEAETTILEFSYLGYITQRIQVKRKTKVDVAMVQDNRALDEVVIMGYTPKAKQSVVGSAQMVAALSGQSASLNIRRMGYVPDQNQESYQKIKENKFINPLKEPLSTFAVDVDAASYSNIRRFINAGSLPDKMPYVLRR
nr:von Willebrand factor type A domain-containing protein [Sphingobacterium sp. DR205]